MLTIQTKKLTEAVKACGALAVNKVIPILACVRVEAAGGVVTVDGTDMDAWLSMSVTGAEGDLPPVCVDAQKLRAALGVGGSGDVRLSVSGEFLSIKGDAGNGRLPLLPAVDFPRMDEDGEAELSFTIPGSDLSSALAALAPAMSTEESRRWLCGISIWRDRDGEVRMTATDGHMLIHAHLPATATGSGTAIGDGVIIPSSTVRMLPADTAPVTVKASRQRFDASGAGWRLRSRMVDFRPTDTLERVIPERGPCWADVDTAELIAAVERVAWASENRHADICMTLREGAIQVDAWSNLGQAATSTVSADVRLGGGPPMEIGFYAKVLLPVLRGMDSDVVSLSWAKDNPNGPVRVDAVGPKDGQRLGVAMPCRMSRPVEMRDAA